MNTPTPVQIVRRRERLGLTQLELADMLGYQARAVRRWENGQRGMSTGAATALIAIENSVARQVDLGVAQLESVAPHARLVVTYRNDAEQDRQARFEPTKPASLLRHAAYQMADKVEGTEVVFADDYYGQNP